MGPFCSFLFIFYRRLSPADVVTPVLQALPRSGSFKLTDEGLLMKFFLVLDADEVNVRLVSSSVSPRMLLTEEEI